MWKAARQMISHPSVTACEMCGLLVADRDLHNSYHVRMADHDRHMISVVEQVSGALEAISHVQDLHGEIIRRFPTIRTK